MSSAADEVARGLRDAILDGELTGGTRLREVAITDRTGAARHTVRAALRALATEGLVTVEANRGATVRLLGPADVRGLYELRAVLEVGAVGLALERGHGELPPEVHAAAARLVAHCRATGPVPWRDVVRAHNALHEALVAASGSARVVAAHGGLLAELQLFLVQGRPRFDRERLAIDHETLPTEIERHGLDVLREHVRLSAALVLS